MSSFNPILGGAGSAEVNKGGYWVKGEGPKKGGSLNPGWNHVPLPIHSHNTLTLAVTNTHRLISHRIIFGFEFYRQELRKGSFQRTGSSMIIYMIIWDLYALADGPQNQSC